MTNSSQQVLGFTLNIKSSGTTITKRLFEVTVGENEKGETVILLVSAIRQPKLRAAKFEDPERLPIFGVSWNKTNDVIELTLKEWEIIKSGGMISRLHGKKTNKHFSTNLETLLDNSGVSFEDWIITALKKAYVRKW